MADENLIDGQKAEKTAKDEGLLLKLRDWSKQESNSRIKQEALWYELQVFCDGDQWIYVPDKSKSSGGTIRIQPRVRRKGEILRTINKIRGMVRALKATTTSTEIRYEVPGGSQDAQVGSNYLNWYVDNYRAAKGATVNSFHDVVGDAAEFGFLRSVGYFDVYWNPCKARPEIESRDPFDLLVDRYGKYALRTYTMRKEDLKTAKNYDGELLFKNIDSPPITTRHSASDVYNNYLDNKYERAGSKNDDLSEVMLEEYHILEEIEEKTEEGQVSEGQASAGKVKYQVRIITSIKDQEKINSDEIDDDDELRFVAFYPERKPNEVYTEPWIKDALDPQKSLNNTFSHMEEFMRVMGKGRLIKRKGVNVDRISDVDGQMIEYEGIEPPVFDSGANIKNSDFNFTDMAGRMIEDVIGLHPSEIQNQRVAKAIGYLLAQDEQNTSEPFRNLKGALVKVGQRLLKLANRHMVASQDIFWWQGGQRTEGKVIGNQKEVPEGVRQIQNVEGLTVDIIPRGAFASLAREEKINQLVQNGMITNPEVAMEGMNIGNVAELVAKEMAFRAQQAQIQAQQAQQGQMGQGQPQQQGNGMAQQGELRKVVEDLKAEIYK